jgi:hypothetical protein
MPALSITNNSARKVKYNATAEDGIRATLDI